MEFRITGIGLAIPGLGGWAAAQPVLTGARPWPADDAPAPSPFLGRTERRRATATVHLAVAAAADALDGQLVNDNGLPAVFTCSGGDMDTLEGICRSLADQPPWISPHRFHNSVHNAPGGYWSIAAGCRGPNTSLSAGEHSTGAGLVEALGLIGADGHDRCLFTTYDQEPPSVFQSVCATYPTFAAALFLERAGAGRHVTADFRPRGPVTPCADTTLEGIRAGNAAARLLPLLIALTRPAASEVILERPNGLIRFAIEAVQ